METLAMTKQLRTDLADVQHEIWSHWMRYLRTKGEYNRDGDFVLAGDSMKRWMRQTETPYQDLTEREQASDLEQADKVLAVLREIAGTKP